MRLRSRTLLTVACLTVIQPLNAAEPTLSLEARQRYEEALAAERRGEISPPLPRFFARSCQRARFYIKGITPECILGYVRQGAAFGNGCTFEDENVLRFSRDCEERGYTAETPNGPHDLNK